MSGLNSTDKLIAGTKETNDMEVERDQERERERGSSRRITIDVTIYKYNIYIYIYINAFVLCTLNAVSHGNSLNPNTINKSQRETVA